MAFCTDSLGTAWSNMTRLLFKPFRLLFWIKAAVIVMFIKGLSLATIFNVAPDEASAINDYEELAAQALEILPAIVGMLLVYLFVVIILEFIRSCSRFILFDAVKNGVIHFKQSTGKHFSGIISLFLWNICIKMIFLILMIISVIVVLIFTGIIGSLLDNNFGLILIIIFNSFFFLFVCAILIIHTIMLNSIIIPQMVIKSKGIFEAWGKAFSQLLKKPAEYIGYTLIQFLILSAGFLLVMLFTLSFRLFSVGLTDFQNGINEQAIIHFITAPHFSIQLFITMIFLPFPILQNAYALCFLKNVYQDNEYDPQNHGQNHDKPPIIDETPESPTPPIGGPVSFSDIPNDAANEQITTTEDIEEDTPPKPPTPPGEDSDNSSLP